MVRSTVTSSRKGTRGGAPIVEPGSGNALASPERTRKASKSSGVARAARGGARWAREFEHDFYVLFLQWLVHQIPRQSADRYFQRLRNRLGTDAVQGGLFLVDHEARLGLVVFEVIIHIHDTVGVLEDLAHRARQGVA